MAFGRHDAANDVVAIKCANTDLNANVTDTNFAVRHSRK